MPGTLARLYMFNHGRDAQRFVSDLKSKNGATIQYGRIRLLNKKYDIDRELDLIARIEVKKVSKLLEADEEYYRVYLDVPVVHNSLEGEWRVKEARRVDLVVYNIEGLDRVALALSDRKDVYRHFEAAIARFSPVVMRPAMLRLHDPELLNDLTSKIGELQWVFVSDIKDPRVTHAMFRGRRLEESEIVMSMTELGRVAGLVIYDRHRGIRITLGRKGSLYTPRDVSAPDMARTLARTLKILVDSGLLTPG